MKKHQVSIVIITEKEDLSPDEEISFRRALDVFAEFNKYLIVPESNHYIFAKSDQLEIIKLPDHHFESVNSYSKLLLSSHFYELFSDSEFILIYQLDCYAFHNNLEEFLSYDYVGAPWFKTQNHTGNAVIRTLLFRKPLTSLGLIFKYYSKHKISAVGNGGFSLRRVDKFIEITNDKRIQDILKSWLKCPRPHEDIFYSFMVPGYITDFKIADIRTALKFSFETYPERCYALNGYQLPVGCHAWAKHDIEFWKKIFSKYNCFVILFFLVFAASRVTGQSIPVGTAVLEDYYRRSQLLGKVDSTVSFTVRPLYTGSVLEPVNKDLKKNIVFKILPFTLQQQYNTHHPYSINDGAMIPARGYQGIVSGGVYAKFGPLSIQLRPEYVYAENRNFQGFYKEQPDNVWAGYYGTMNYIDLPERFGDGPYSRLFWGQSSIRLTAGNLSLGFSNENLWWGTGIRNSFIMSNTAPGFLHLTLNTVKPVRTFLGSFEGQLICGRLEDSGFPPDTSRTYNGVKLYSPKRTDWRYVNALVLSYHPKWIQGLFLGLTRNFITYYKDMGTGFKDYFPIITPITKDANYGEKEGYLNQDQRASVFLRWLWQKEHAELYWEFGREDHAFNTRDLFVGPDHTRAYVLGFQKLLSFKGRKDQYVQVGVEVTQLAQTGTNPERSPGSIYLHYAGISQGYTNRGQLLGAGIGPGSNMQTVNVSWVKNYKKIGLQVERYVHHNDFYTGVIKDIRANWVDFSTSAIAEWDYRNFFFTAKIDVIRSYNYQWLYHPEIVASSNFWTPGRDVYNYQGNFSVTYRF